MKRLVFILAAALCVHLAAAATLPAEKPLPLSYGLDAQLDSLHFAAFRERLDSIRVHRPTVAVVFSGGGAKSAAQVGAIKLLQEKGVPVDFVIGASMGGFMAGVASLGYTGDEIEEIVGGIDWDNMVIELLPRRQFRMDRKLYRDRYMVSLPYGKDHPLIPMGVFHAQNFRNTINSLAVGYGDEIDFMDLPVPLITLSTDIITAHPKYWMSGQIADAMFSTFSVPGLFVPVRKHGMILGDAAFTNNYPVQKARELGADIVIGLDVAAPRAEYGDIKSGVNVFMQVFDMLGMDPFRESYSHLDMNIRADLDGFDMLSFSKASIDTLLSRGNQSIAVYETAVDSLAHAVAGAEVATISHRKAINISKEKVAVNSIDFEGVEDKNRMLKHFGLNDEETRLIGKEDLDRIAARLRGTREYVAVTYRILGTEAPYQVVFDCIPNPGNTVGIGLRADSEEYVSALFNLGVGTIGTGHSLDANIRLGFNSAIDLEYSYRTKAGLDPFVRIGTGYYAHDKMCIQPTRPVTELNFFRASAAAGVITRFSDWFQAEIAASTQYYLIGSRTVNISYPQIDAYLNLRGDTFNNDVFPTKGLRFNLRYEHCISDYRTTHALPGAISADLEFAFTLGKLFTVHPHGSARMFFEESNPLMFNMLSVGYDGRTMAHQRAFIGLNDAVILPGQTMVMAGLDLQFNVGKGHYISLLSDFANNMLGARETPMGFNNGYMIAGAGLQYGMDFVLGSVLRADLHWSTLDGFGAYIALGMDF